MDIVRWLLEKSDPMMVVAVLLLGFFQIRFERSLRETRKVIFDHIGAGEPHQRCALEGEHHDDMCERLNGIDASIKNLAERIDRVLERK